MRPPEVLQEIYAANPGITHIQLVKLPSSDGASLYDAIDCVSVADTSQQEGRPSEHSFIGSALKLSKKWQLPLWDVLFARLLVRQGPVAAYLKPASRHNSLGEAIRVKTSLSLAMEILEIVAALSPIVIGVRSEVGVQGRRMMHIPLLDFHCPASDINRVNVVGIAKALGIPGYIFESGRSYHFYGDTLLTRGELNQFLGRALLFSPFVDRAWIAHQMIEGACTLRISARTPGGQPPLVVGRIAKSEVERPIDRG